MIICKQIFKNSTLFRTSRVTVLLRKHIKEISTTYAISGHHVRNMAKIEPKTIKLDTPQFHNILTPELLKIAGIFEKYNYELRIAGGAVRDLLMNIVSDDIDFATTATPDEMKAMFDREKIRMFNFNGEKHGTITARIDDKENFECTTLRIDIRTDGRHAEVEWTTDWQLDALRRDLTVNSLFLGLDGTVYDYFSGIEDLKNKRVRFVGSAQDRIQEDYLRILRYFRFFGRIVDDPDSHEAETLRAIRENADGLKNISGERIWMELKKILTGRYAEAILPVMHETGITPYFGLPEKIDLEEYKKVCARSEGLEPQATTRIAALLQETQQMYELNDRLKISREELRNGIFIIEHRQDQHNDFRYFKDLHCDTQGKEPKTRDRISELVKYWGEKELLNQFTDWTPPRFPVNGNSLIERGVQKGPAFAQTLQGLRQLWKESDYTLDEEQLLKRISEIEIVVPAKKAKTKK